MDLFGPIAYLSIEESKYGFVIVNDYAHFTWVLFLHDKHETQGTLKWFLRWSQNEFDLRIKKIRSDNGIKSKNLQVEEYLVDEGIKHEFFAPTHHNRMEWWKGRTRSSSRWREQCSKNTERELGLHLFPKWFWWLNCPTQIIGLTSLL
jgi:5-formaminoimidazole-4-carboxamide-1-beta-D-ribofuranosyl 5'-monophosphate synthetase